MGELIKPYLESEQQGMSPYLLYTYCQMGQSHRTSQTPVCKMQSSVSCFWPDNWTPPHTHLIFRIVRSVNMLWYFHIFTYMILVYDNCSANDYHINVWFLSGCLNKITVLAGFLPYRFCFHCKTTFFYIVIHHNALVVLTFCDLSFILIIVIPFSSHTLCVCPTPLCSKSLRDHK